MTTPMGTEEHYTMPRTTLQNIQRMFPKDTIVRYVGHRLPDRVGQLARVIDYKDANGL
jgi:hypothetical protein